MATVAEKAFSPSKYQQAVFNWVVNGSGHAVIKAVPGSGKSTTLIHASKLLTTSNAVFLAFNKSIEVELNVKLTEQGSLMKAQTINSFGFSALKATGLKYKVDANKYHGICKDYLISCNLYEYKLLQKFKKLISLVRMTLTDPTSEEAIWDLVEHYDIDLDRQYEAYEWGIVWNGIKKCLDAGEYIAKQGVIDFDDQVYLPIVWGLTPEKKDWIFVDESQDLNEARLELIIRSVNGRGRLLFVGDECQAIYGFSGAGTDSMNVIIERTKATVLPLSICYRCPSSHIDLCAKIFPGLEARPNAPAGTIEHINFDRLNDIVRPGDLVLCRMNAPLVSTCLDLIRSGVRAKVRGSDIGASFIATLKKLNKQYPMLSIELFVDVINSYRDQQAIMIGVGEDSDMKIAALDDRVDTMKALREAYCTQNTNPRLWDMESFYEYIENFFSDETGPLVVLSTVHKAKGLEENRVFILHPEKMPHPKAKAGWQYEQELNIKYVAYSRSKDALYFVHDNVPAPIEDEDDELDAPAVVLPPVVVEEVPPAAELAPVAHEENSPLAEEKKDRKPAGRKPLADSDKPQKLEAYIDPDIKSAFQLFVVQMQSLDPETVALILPSQEEVLTAGGKLQAKKVTGADIVEAALLAFPPFQKFLEQSGQKAAYEDRKARREQARQDYKSRKQAPAPVVESDDHSPDDDPDGNGGGMPLARHEEAENAPVSEITEETTMEEPTPAMAIVAPNIASLFPVDGEAQIRRVWFSCLRPKCKKNWYADYYQLPDGRMYRKDDDDAVIWYQDDFQACPACGNERCYIRRKIVKTTYSSKRKCDSRCYNARPGSECSCQCGGVNHATGHANHVVQIGKPLLTATH